MITTLHIPQETRTTMSAGDQSIEGILSVILADAERAAAAIPWYQPPANLRQYDTDKVGKDIEWALAPANMQRWVDLQNWKQACNEVAVLTGEPLPYPPKVLPKDPVLKLRHPSAFSFKDTATLLSTEIEQLRTSYATENELAGLDMCLDGPDCCQYHKRMKELGRILPAGVSQLDKDMERGKPFVPSSTRVQNPSD